MGESMNQEHSINSSLQKVRKINFKNLLICLLMLLTQILNSANYFRLHNSRLREEQENNMEQYRSHKNNNLGQDTSETKEIMFMEWKFQLLGVSIILATLSLTSIIYFL
uniref:Uncharacterized protein n=1 Tax=Micrurus lemniscatus lemniscatus TaxID=129467 RepID=A0A2D4HBA4_MICLE